MTERAKKFAIFSAIAVVLLLSIVFALLSQNNGKSGTNGVDPGTLPQYTLDQAEEKMVKEFVITFVSLYNTYSYNDLSNPQALGEYQTAPMQQRTLDNVTLLEQSLPEGYNKLTVPSDSSFSYTYPGANTLLVTVEAEVTESGVGVYPVSAQLTLLRSGTNWYVDSFELVRK